MRAVRLGARALTFFAAFWVALTAVRVAEAQAAKGGGVNIGTLRTFVQAIFNGTISITGQAVNNAIVWNGTAWVAGVPVGAPQTWATVLTAGNLSGASNPTIATGQSLVGQTALTLDTTGANFITFSINGTPQWTVDASGDLSPSTTNADDLGLPANLVRNVYVGTQVIAPQEVAGGVTEGYSFTGATDAGFYYDAGALGPAVRVGAGGTGFHVSAGGALEFIFTSTAFAPVTDSANNSGTAAARFLGTFTDYTAHQLRAISTTPTTLTATGEELVTVDASGGARTVNLPAINAVDVGRRYVIKDTGSAGTNNVTVDADGAELIDGAATYVLTVNYQSVTIFSNGTKWLIE